ncbi:hypothetical protein CEP45_06895 [Mergibacter septicus]|uniref:hypothetical protein n=1 Tax=Mergibacter septicus TaxID=221402 RepID=UPI001C748745|nr:hypothetical protein [Mergibacter septicus]QDJ13588.1 hypothetical protein CEP45_06895 [Mergibacter septicus]
MPPTVLGEKNVIYFKNSESNHSLNIINSTSQDFVSELTKLKQTIVHQTEMIEMQKTQIEFLQSLVKTLENKNI